MNVEHSDGGRADSSRRIPSFVVICALALVSVLSLWVFRPVLANGFVQWDDHIYLAELMRMGRFSRSSLHWMWTSLQPFYFQPIAWMTHLADYQVWGLNPRGHHLTNLLMHGVYVWVVGALVWLLTGKVAGMRPGERLAMSVLVALVCGIHPLQVESVAWMAARNGLLCSLWMVAALCAYVMAARDGNGLRPFWWWTAVGLNVAAMLTKPFAVSLPVVMLAIDYFPLRRFVAGARRTPAPVESNGENSFTIASPIKRFALLVGEKWPVVLLSALASAGAIRARVQMHTLAQELLRTRLLIASRSIVFYLWKIVWPAWLSPFYPLSDQVSLGNAEFWVPALICVVVTIVAVLGRRRMPALMASWVSYLAILLPVCGLVQVGGQAVADRYAYLAMVPALLVLGSAALWVWRRFSALLRVTLCVGLGAWLVLLGMWTRGQIEVWHDSVSLWSGVLEHFPDDPRANYNLAVALLQTHHLDEARAAIERAIAHSDPYAMQLPMAHGTLGVIYLKMGEYDRAVEELQGAIAADGTLWAARYNLACAYARMGRVAEAYDVLRALLATQPQYAQLAVRDGELRPLRDDPEYQARFAGLIDAVKSQ